MEVIFRVIAHAGQNRNLCLSDHGRLPKTLGIGIYIITSGDENHLCGTSLHKISLKAKAWGQFPKLQQYVSCTSSGSLSISI